MSVCTAAFAICLSVSSSAAPSPAVGDPWSLLLDGRAEEAAGIFAERISLDPDDGDAVAGRVRSLLRLDRWREALAEARSHRERSPGDAAVRAALAEALYRAGRIERAGLEAESAVALEESPGRSAALLGLVRAAQGRDDDAATWLARARQAAPGDRDILLWSAGAAESRAEAVDLLRAYLERSDGDDPDRVEAARGTLRLYRALGERPVWIPERWPDRASLDLEPLFDRPGRPTGYRIEADVGEGKPLSLLFDTGSPGLYVLRRKVRKRGLESVSEETVFGGGGDRRHETRRGILPRFALGEVVWADALASVTRREIDPTGRYHGIVGIDPFRGYRIAIDLARHRLGIDGSSEPLSDGEPYWTVAGQLLVEATTGSGERGLWLLDTGATRSVVADSLAEREPGVTLGGPTAVRGFGGALARAREVRGMKIRFAGREVGATLHATDLSLRSRLGGVEVSGFLGLDLLEGRRLVIDTRSRRVLLVDPDESLGSRDGDG